MIDEDEIEKAIQERMNTPCEEIEIQGEAYNWDGEVVWRGMGKAVKIGKVILVNPSFTKGVLP